MADEAGVPRDAPLRAEAARGRGRGACRWRPARLRHADRRHLRPRGPVPRLRTRRSGSAGPVELPGSRPLDIDGGGSLAAKLIEWPVDHTDQVPLLHASGRSGRDCRRGRSGSCCRVHDAARTVGRELLVEIIAGKNGTARRRHGWRGSYARLYAIGLRPDWWKLEGQPSERGLVEHRSRRSASAIRALPRHHAARPRRSRRTTLERGVPHRLRIAT